MHKRNLWERLAMWIRDWVAQWRYCINEALYGEEDTHASD